MSLMRRLPLCFLLFTLVPACGGSKPPANAPQAAAAEAQPGVPHGPQGKGTQDDPVRLCHMNGGPNRSDYPYIANYRCSDGSMPLGGDSDAGAEARVGNVGEGPDGHIVDLYRIPCPGAPVEVYVDAYHCGPHVNAEAELDIDHLSRDDQAAFASTIRITHEDPSSLKAMQRRAAFTDILLKSNQIHLELCDRVAVLLPQTKDPNYLGEFFLAMGASLMEDGSQHPDPVSINVNALAGVLVYYLAVIRERGEGARDPQMDALLDKAKDKTGFTAYVRTTLGDCGSEHLGVDPP
ncbi:MAG: hypothetical protein R3B07_23535 [Polyangiaceae bacterium]